MILISLLSGFILIIFDGQNEACLLYRGKDSGCLVLPTDLSNLM